MTIKQERGLDIYDPVRAQLLDDIAEKLIDPRRRKSEGTTREALLTILRLRGVIPLIAPWGSPACQKIMEHMSANDFKMIYWREYSAEEYRKIEERRRSEEAAVAWIGA